MINACRSICVPNLVLIAKCFFFTEHTDPHRCIDGSNFLRCSRVSGVLTAAAAAAAAIVFTLASCRSRCHFRHPSVVYECYRRSFYQRQLPTRREGQGRAPEPVIQNFLNVFGKTFENVSVHNYTACHYSIMVVGYIIKFILNIRTTCR